jgi:AcrR family transcriptional regulator
VAHRLFEKHGYHDVSLADIASELGIRAPSLLYHFECKEELLDAVLERFYARGRERVVEALASSGSAGDRIERVVEVVRELWQRNRGLVRIAITELMKPGGVGRKHVFEIAQPTLERVEAVLHDSVSPPVPAAALLRAAMMTVLASHLWRLAMGDVGRVLWGAEEDLAELQAILFRGLQEWPAESTARGKHAGSDRELAGRKRPVRGGRGLQKRKGSRGKPS